MKHPRLHFPRPDVHSLGFQTSLELAGGGLLIALLLRWLM
jgi:hypothetical protein